MKKKEESVNKPAKSSKLRKKYTYAVGRRKGATATLRLYEGKGKWLVNEHPIEEYFPGAVMASLYNRPFVIGESEGKFWGIVKTNGGGKKGQLSAVILAISRALAKYNTPVYRPLLKKAGLLTVDSRVRERRKVGQMGKARKKKQSPKR